MIKCFHWNLVSEHLIEIFSRAPKDWKVVLQNDGNGIKFVDKNGDVIVVEIDNNKWGNITVNEDTPLRIRGEIDKDLTKTEIDVDSVEVVK